MTDADTIHVFIAPLISRAASVHSIQGLRGHMEDAYYADHTTGFFAVYDGHGGARCSAYAAQHLHNLVYKHTKIQTSKSNDAANRKSQSYKSDANSNSNSNSSLSNSATHRSSTSQSHSSPNAQINGRSTDTDSVLTRSSSASRSAVSSASDEVEVDTDFDTDSEAEGDDAIIRGLRDAFDELDKSWLSVATLNHYDDGSTAIVCLIHNSVLYVANCGDSRCVLVSSGGYAQDMSVDHKPNSASEKSRIEALGGRIIYYGTWRVEGILAVTRSIGDRRLKRYVSSRPDIVTRRLRPGDDYAVLASDGVWDVLSSQAACDLVVQGSGANAQTTTNAKSHSRDSSSSSSSSSSITSVAGAATRITNQAYNLHSMDNITSMVVDLRPYRKQTK